MTELALQHGLGFADLYERDGLIRLDRAFVAHLAAADMALHDRLMAARVEPEALDRKAAQFQRESTGKGSKDRKESVDA